MSIKIREYYNHWLPRWLNVGAITLWPFIFYGKPLYPDYFIVRKHEWIHIDQIRRDGVITFYVLYLWYYLRNRIKGMSHMDAYINNSYEQEAFRMQYKSRDSYE